MQKTRRNQPPISDVRTYISTGLRMLGARQIFFKGKYEKRAAVFFTISKLRSEKKLSPSSKWKSFDRKF